MTLTELIAAATPGPWKYAGNYEEKYGADCIAAGITLVTSYPTLDIDDDQACKNMRLIVAAVNALPKLLAALEAADVLRTHLGHLNCQTYDAARAAVGEV